MCKSKKSLFLCLLALLLLLIILCISTKVSTIYDEIYSKNPSITVVKKDGKINISGIFKDSKLVNSTVDKFKMFNKDVSKDNITINGNITDDKWKNIMANISYYFSNNLEDATMTYKDGKLTIEGENLSQSFTKDILNALETLKKDGIEVQSNFRLLETNKANLNAKREIYDTLYGKSIEFEINKALIKEETLPLLDKITSVLKKSPNLSLSIEGHTDDSGEDEFNKKLSYDRAVAIRDYFVSKGIEQSRLYANGYGELRPAFPNNSVYNRQRNRRVEFKVRGE